MKTVYRPRQYFTDKNGNWTSVPKILSRSLTMSAIAEVHVVTLDTTKGNFIVGCYTTENEAETLANMVMELPIKFKDFIQNLYQELVGDVIGVSITMVLKSTHPAKANRFKVTPLTPPEHPAVSSKSEEAPKAKSETKTEKKDVGTSNV